MSSLGRSGTDPANRRGSTLDSLAGLVASPPMPISTATVLIVGAGPTGLTLAIELERRGVPYRIIERDLERHEQSRATDIQARTLEIFHDLEVIDQALANGQRRVGATIRADGRLLARLEFGEADTPYACALGLAQHETQRILEDRLIELGGRVERGVRVADLQQTADEVTATLLYADQRWDEQRFAWVVGCDGARSAVRRSLNVSFAGSTFAESYFLVDVDLASPWPTDELLLVATAHGLGVIGPMGRGRVRVMGDLDPEFAGELDDGVCDELIRGRLGQDVAIAGLGWRATFRVHTRMVERYRDGRVFLCGDAAHIHSPITGHGMNTGIQDAYNLGWKLALVEQGEAAASLLDSYQAERHPIAAALLAKTDFQTRMLSSRNRVVHGALAALGQLAFRLDAAQQRILSSAVELDVTYPDSPIVDEQRGSVFSASFMRHPDDEEPSFADYRSFSAGPKPGERAPDLSFGDVRVFDLIRGIHHNLILFDGLALTDGGYNNLADIAREAEARWPTLIRVHVIVLGSQLPASLDWVGSRVLDPDQQLHRRYGATAECLYLIRPDGYVGFRAQPATFAGIERYMTRLLETPT